ncbi:phage holin family protein [Paenibacillus thiaminolyticus]|uniref:phage holin family protein n=1 Tax=Paenibacillus thiaminolyticus TaxID=49283 RepID=UPI0035A6A0AD
MNHLKELGLTVWTAAAGANAKEATWGAGTVSEVMFWGGIRKMTILFVIGLAALIDSCIQPGSLLFRTIAIFFYAGREGLSVVENLGVYGVDSPPKLVAFLEQLNEKGKEVDDHDHRS